MKLNFSLLLISVASLAKFGYAANTSEHIFSCDHKFVVSGNELKSTTLFGSSFSLNVKCDDMELILSNVDATSRNSAFDAFKNLYEGTPSKVAISMPKATATFKRTGVSDNVVSSDANYSFSTHDADGFKVTVVVTITFANSVASVNFLPTRISDSNALINVPHVINTRAAPLRPANPTVTPTLTSHDGTKAQHSLDNIHQLMKDHYFAVRRVFNKQDLTALDSQTGKITKILFSDRYYVLATASPDDKFRVILGRSKYDDKTVVPPVVAALPPSASAKASSFLVSMDYTTIGIGLFAVGGIYFLLSYRVHNSAASKKAKK